MQANLQHVIEHALTIVQGHTGMSFLAGLSPFRRSDLNDAKHHITTWTSEELPITGGAMGMLSKSVRIRITLPTIIQYDDVYPSGTEELPMANPNGDFAVSVTFIFTSPMNAETAMNRQIQFRGLYFRRFD